MIYDWQQKIFLESDGQFLLESGGYFETIKIENQQLNNPQLHSSRLVQALEAHGYTDFPPFLHILSEVTKLLQTAAMEPFNVLKLVYFPLQNEVYFQFRVIEYDDVDYSEGVRVQVAATPRPLTYEYEFKSTNRTQSIQLREQAKQNGYYEVLYQTADQALLEGTVSNVFLLKADTIYTPPLHGILKGTMRTRLFRLFPERIKEQNIYQDDLKQYDGAFLTNALIGVMPIKEIEWNGTSYAYDVAVVNQLKKQINEKDEVQ